LSALFTLQNWITNAGSEVVVPLSIRGSEVVALSMSLERLEVTLENRGVIRHLGELPHGQSTIKILFHEPKQIILNSDHLQNIVSTAYIFEKENFKFEQHIDFFELENVYAILPTLDAKYFVFFTPITGIELFVAANEIEIYLSQT
jgi:hypothetical protein